MLTQPSRGYKSRRIRGLHCFRRGIWIRVAAWLPLCQVNGFCSGRGEEDNLGAVSEALSGPMATQHHIHLVRQRLVGNWRLPLCLSTRKTPTVLLALAPGSQEKVIHSQTTTGVLQCKRSQPRIRLYRRGLPSARATERQRNRKNLQVQLNG